MSESPNREWFIIGTFALGTLLLHMLVSTNYELHRDAYLYLADAAHPSWGYLSIPPLTPFVAHYWTLLFGHSVFAVRLIPAFIGALSIVIIGQIVRELGGRSWATVLACLAYLVSPAFLRSNSLFQPVSFDSFFWLLGTWAMVRLLRTEDQRWWLALCIIFGFGFLNKYSIIFPAISFVIGLSLTKQRSLFRSRWLLYGAIIGLVIILPNLLWQFNHNWPVVHHMTQLRDSQLIHVRLSDFLVMQVFMILPALLVFLAGLFYVLLDKSAQPFRAIGWMYPILMLLLIVLSGKSYYTLGIYPVFFAFGGIAITRYTGGKLQWSRSGLVVLMVCLILPGLPMSLPVLSYPAMVGYDKVVTRLGMDDLLQWEDGTVHPLPQDYADMTGWQELASIVDSTWNSLSPGEQKVTGIYAENYGEAGAIRYFNRHKRIPEPISFNGSFLFWAPDSVHGTTLIYVNDDTSDIRKQFQEVILAGRITNPYAREHGMQVYLCRRPINGFGKFYVDKVKRLRSEFERGSKF
ncbi:MAG TPA: glycosyltransferase family 39 protein [Balneolales bacterium]|nr:glycosyltransferase family 39 protein [Balneolales bacterium]